MKKIISFLIGSFVFFNFTYGKQIDEKTAKTVGQNFLTTQDNSRMLKSSSDLALVQTVYSGNMNRPVIGKEKGSDILGYTSLPKMTEKESNNIVLNGAMTITPGTTLIRGQSVSVHLDVLNTGPTAFSGTFDVSIYDPAGFVVFTVQEMTGMNMPSNYHFPNGLTFANPNVTCTPGSYLLAIQYLPDGLSQSWHLIDSTNYPNPVKIIVQDNPLGIDNLSLNAVRIYPNPVKDVLHLDLTSFIGNFNQIQIVNMEGKQVLNVFKVPGGREYTIPIDKLTDGLYFLQMRTATGLYSKKFVLRR